MSTSIEGSVTLSIDSNFQNVLDMRTASDRIQQVIQETFANGTGANQAQIHFGDEITLAGGANVDIDLNAVAGAFGDMAFAKIKLILINNKTEEVTGAGLMINGGSSTGLIGNTGPLEDGADNIPIPIGSPFLWSNLIDGHTVPTPGIMRLTNYGSTPITFDMIIIGTGALT